MVASRTNKNICHQILRFTEYLGASERYNKTLMVAAIKAFDIFTSEGAKKEFLEPDLQPFGPNF
jgi:hypothetical protein